MIEQTYFYNATGKKHNTYTFNFSGVHTIKSRNPHYDFEEVQKHIQKEAAKYQVYDLNIIAYNKV